MAEKIKTDCESEIVVHGYFDPWAGGRALVELSVAMHDGAHAYVKLTPEQARRIGSALKQNAATAVADANEAAERDTAGK